MGLKVSESDEILGLDLAEHGTYIYMRSQKSGRSKFFSRFRLFTNAYNLLGLSAYHGEHHGQIHDHHEDETKPINDTNKDHYNSIGDRHPHSF